MAKSSRDININAPADTVWSILKDASTWPLWFPNIEGGTGLSAVQNGATFQWQEGAETNTGMVTQMDEANDVLEVVTKEDGKQVTHRFDVDRRGLFSNDKCKVSYSIDYDAPGGFIGDFVASGNPMDLTRMNKTLDKLRDLSEGKAGR